MDFKIEDDIEFNLEFYYQTDYLLKCMHILKKTDAVDLFDRCKDILKIQDEDWIGLQLLRDFLNRNSR